jgi:hypothetical protein
MTSIPFPSLARPAVVMSGLALAAAVMLAGPPAALAHTETSSSGAVSAQLSYDKSAAQGFSNLRLSITRDGVAAYSRPVSSAACGSLCSPAGFGTKPSVRSVDLDADGEPEVLLDLYTGGAHCCSVSEVFSWNAATATYRNVERNWWDPGYALADLDHNGRVEFRSADDHFAYAFAAFAFSGLPVQIWRYDHGTFVDVTQRYRALIATDARGWLRQFNHWARQGEGEGFLAAWAADEERLGQGALVDRKLSRALRAGQLRGTTASGRRYVSDLKRFLRRHGYR